MKVVLLADVAGYQTGGAGGMYLLSNLVAARVYHPIAGLAAPKILLFALKTDQY